MQVVNDFLKVNKYVDFETVAIQEKAKALFKNCVANEDKVKIAFEFVRDQIPHSFDCQASVITAKASDVLKHRTGICHAKSNLLAALLRSQGIPVGFCYQHLTLVDDDSKGYCLHCYNAVFIDNKWIQLDARGNKKNVNAQFSMEQPILAFSNRPQYDEYYFDGIYSEPDIVTMELLENAKTVEEVAEGLPESPVAKPAMLLCDLRASERRER